MAFHRPELCPKINMAAAQLGEWTLSFSGVYSGGKRVGLTAGVEICHCGCPMSLIVPVL